MPEIEITQNLIEVSVDETGSSPVVTINEVPAPPPEVIEVGIIGPQGPQGPQGLQGPPGSSTLADLTDVSVENRVDKSLLYYDSASGKWKGDEVETMVTLLDGGNY